MVSVKMRQRTTAARSWSPLFCRGYEFMQVGFCSVSLQL